MGKEQLRERGVLGNRGAENVRGEKKGRSCVCELGQGQGDGGGLYLCWVREFLEGQRWGLEERRLGSTWQGLSVTFTSKEQTRPQQVPFLRG